MILWLILTAMTAAAVLYVAAPFLRAADKTAPDGSQELAIYRDQLAEIDREAASGAIDASAAEQARAEVKRRLLAADKTARSTAAPRPLTALEYRFAFMVMTVLTVPGSAVLYAYSGNPGVPSAIPSGSGSAPQQAGGGDTGPGNAAPSSAQLEAAEAMITKLALRLKANPNDLKGWMTLGWAYMGTGNFGQAAEAYRKAVALEPKSASARVGLADALIQSADGKVTPEASAAIDQALALDDKEPRALFLRGLGKSQSGNPKGAIDDWFTVLGLAQPDDPWGPEVRQRIVDLAKQANIDVSARLPSASAAATAQTPPTAQPALTGPTQAEVDAAQTMSEADRMAMIKGMVQRLADKLEASPRNVDGWIQLMRSRKLLGEAGEAAAALKKSLAVFADSPADQQKLKAAAGELGIGS